MTPSNMWALIIGLLLVGGAVIGGVAWHQSHPESQTLSRLVEPLTSKKEAPPAAAPEAPKPAPPEARESKPEAPNAQTPETNTAKTETAKTDTPKPEAAPKTEATPAGKPGGPQFDVVRVEPSGDAVFAGQSQPNANVALVDGGKVVAETRADATGHFVMLPPALKPGDHDLSLQQRRDGQLADPSKQNVAVSIPKKGTGEVVVALAEPGKPTKLLSAPPKAPAPAVANAPPPEAQKPAGAPDNKDVAPAKPETAVAPPAVAPKAPDLAFRTVELEQDHGFYATGVATPGTKIELYLNGAHLAEVTAGPDGQWSVTIKKGLAGGHYAVRADAIGQDHKVTARAEVPFDVPVAMAAPVKPAPGPAKVAAATPAPVPPSSPARTGPDPNAPAPYSAPSPSEVAGLGPDATLAGPSPKSDIRPLVPAPRADLAAAAKATAEAAVKTPSKAAPPTLAMAPPAKVTAPEAVPAPTPPRAATAPQSVPQKMAVAPAKPADAPPTLAAAKPAVAPPKRAEVAAAVAAKPAVPAAPAASPAPSVAPVAPAAPAPATANAVIEEVETALVVPGDNLWNISRARLGNPTRYTQIYAANVSQIRNPNLIYPGQVFVMPQ